MKKERLRKLLMLALRSEGTPGERTACLDAIKRIIALDGKDETWFIDKVFGDDPPPLPFVMSAPIRRRPTPREAVHWATMLDYLNQAAVLQRIRYREIEFIASLSTQESSRRFWEPTGRQLNWLTAIYEREFND